MEAYALLFYRSVMCKWYYWSHL